MSISLDPFDPAVMAADYLIAALGSEGARLAACALRAGWMTDTERKTLEPIASSIAVLIGDKP